MSEAAAYLVVSLPGMAVAWVIAWKHIQRGQDTLGVLAFFAGLCCFSIAALSARMLFDS